VPDSPETPDPGLSPAQEQQVRRLLADARHTDPVPDDVVARLDRVLADLASEPDREAAVVHLADRRRNVGRWLVAAAAVVVLGVGVNEVVDLAGSSGGSDSLTASDESAGEEEPAAAPGAAEGGASADSRDATRTRPYRVSEDDFSRDVDALRVLPLDAVSGSVDEPSDGELNSDGQAAYDRGALRRAASQEVCEPGGWGRGGYVPVLYDRAAGWVVLRRPRGETQVVDLFICGSEQAVRSVTLPVP
jgi:hypothetical protein